MTTAQVIFYAIAWIACVWAMGQTPLEIKTADRNRMYFTAAWYMFLGLIAIVGCAVTGARLLTHFNLTPTP